MFGGIRDATTGRSVKYPYGEHRCAVQLVYTHGNKDETTDLSKNIDKKISDSTSSNHGFATYLRYGADRRLTGPSTT